MEFKKEKKQREAESSSLLANEWRRMHEQLMKFVSESQGTEWSETSRKKIVDSVQSAGSKRSRTGNAADEAQKFDALEVVTLFLIYGL
ncbi:hypothetical protein PC116_g24885 [Phytophthora cactorum]|uniref:Uncharacterized protein n=1 Tax=Phytophthora cactorum TaxID=29920 RepID=A0A8T1JY06_9STRA|nr:hypothetical protein PC117_g8197 [Phytophthora cactorum]KAG3026949.1 hypothetical protein PC119_g7591 [Phytophthora cactorum]KAG4226711.1 hypothetical protein PC116_g24885 [Phytophthora cactorum]